MQNDLLLILSLLFVVSLLMMLSNKLGISYPIFLVIAGLIIGVIPDIPNISLDPELVFIIFLPPLLYAAAWNTSWRQFWFYKRQIALLSIGLVISTSCAIAFISHTLIPDFSLELGFVLGGIISPPDAVAATSVLSKLKIPKRIVTILEGESLVNDASSLIVFRFALAAIFTGQFVLWKAGLNFLIVAGTGIFIGIAIAGIIYLIHRFLPTDSSIDTAITLIAPYIMYLTAEHFKVSGVLAVVSGGLFLSNTSSQYFNYDSRLQIQSVWDTIVFLLNGIVFILIGMQLPLITQGLEAYTTMQAIGYAVIISVATVVVRILWVFPGTYLPRMLSRRIRERESRPSWRLVVIVGWSGMRGVVSLASALTIPVTLANKEVFPHRNLILFITFSVILFTLVLQGLTLPFLIRLLKIKTDDGDEELSRLKLNKDLAQTVISYFNESYRSELQKSEIYKRIKERYERVADDIAKQIEDQPEKRVNRRTVKKIRILQLEMIQVQRKQLDEMRKNDGYSDELLREKEYELDLEEARARRISIQ